MQKLITICCSIALLLSLPLVAWAASDLSAAPVFGKVTYQDSDSNGFSDATWLGMRLEGEYQLPQWQLPQWQWLKLQGPIKPITVQLRYDYGMNNDAVGQDSDWEELVSEMNTDGKLSQQTLNLSLLYPVGNFRFGLGYLLNKFKETEYGFAEHRDYSGLCLLAYGNITKDGLTRFGLRYAPTLSVADKVKGDWDDADRTAAVSYGGSYWEINVERTLLNRERFWLNAGINWSVLSGDGVYQADYRFLQHDLTVKEFYVKADWRF